MSGSTGDGEGKQYCLNAGRSRLAVFYEAFQSIDYAETARCEKIWEWIDILLARRHGIMSLKRRGESAEFA